jgi:peptidoglycan/xylan/chitin deacetylase (PgdA/CDA1 family)
MGAVKRGIDFTAKCAVSTGFLRMLERMGDGQAKLLRVLTYHRVDEPTARPNLYPNLIGATPAEFDWQMRCLAERFRVVSMADVFGAIVHGKPLPPKSVLITFDDAYRDFAEHAWPILKSYGLPVTVFVPTGFPDQPQKSFWWDRVFAAIRETRGKMLNTPLGPLPLMRSDQRKAAMRTIAKIIKSETDDTAQKLVQSICTELGATPEPNSVLSWDELRQLAREGVTLAPHTRNHPLLSRVDESRIREEVAGSIKDLKEQIGEVLPVLAYPSGAFNQIVVRILPTLGVPLAFTTCRGLNNLDRIDPLRLRRVNIGRPTSPALLRTQLLPWMAHLNRWLPLPEAN